MTDDPDRGHGHRPSDAPGKTTLMLGLLRDRRRLEQHQRNLRFAGRWIDAGDVALSRLERIIDTMLASIDDRSGSQAVAAANGLVPELRHLLNAQLEGRFLFAGTAAPSQAFDEGGRYRGNDLPLVLQVTDEIALALGIDGSHLYLPDRPDRSLLTLVSEADDLSRIENDLRQLLEQVGQGRDRLRRQRNQLGELHASIDEAMADTHNHWIEAHRRPHPEELRDRWTEASIDATLSAALSAISHAIGPTIDRSVRARNSEHSAGASARHDQSSGDVPLLGDD